jgi:hypothetical protein
MLFPSKRIEHAQESNHRFVSIAFGLSQSVGRKSSLMEPDNA